MLLAQIGVFMLAAGVSFVLFREDREPFVEIRAVKEPPSNPSAPPTPHPNNASLEQESKVESEEKLGQPNDEEEVTEILTEPPGEQPEADETIAEETVDKDSRLVLRLLSGDERTVFRSIVDAGGETYQKDIVTGTKLSDAKVSRVLEKLEEKGLIEKERHGMTNVVRVKIE